MEECSRPSRSSLGWSGPSVPSIIAGLFSRRFSCWRSLWPRCALAPSGWLVAKPGCERLELRSCPRLSLRSLSAVAILEWRSPLSLNQLPILIGVVALVGVGGGLYELFNASSSNVARADQGFGLYAEKGVRTVGPKEWRYQPTLFLHPDFGSLVGLCLVPGSLLQPFDQPQRK